MSAQPPEEFAKCLDNLIMHLYLDNREFELRLVDIIGMAFSMSGSAEF